MHNRLFSDKRFGGIKKTGKALHRVLPAMENQKVI